MSSIPTPANRAIFCILLLLHALMLFGLPPLLTRSLWWGLALVPFAWLAIVQWGLIHEAIHKLLFADAHANDLGGRALSIALGISFHVVRFGHLMHHQLNRQLYSEQIASPTFAQRIYYYVHLFLGTYLTEIYTGMLFLLLPRRRFMQLARASFLHEYENVAVAGERFFYERGNIEKTRTDMLLGLVLYAAAFVVYGPHWLWLVAFIALRAIVISFMDNIYHYATPSDNSKPGKELFLPPFVSRLILHGNYHDTHHRNPLIPWHRLPQAHHAHGNGFDGGFFHHGRLQFNGPAWS